MSDRAALEGCANAGKAIKYRVKKSKKCALASRCDRCISESARSPAAMRQGHCPYWQRIECAIPIGCRL